MLRTQCSISFTTLIVLAMSAQEKDVLADIDVPEDLFAQLLSNIQVAAKAQGKGVGDSPSAVNGKLPGSVRESQSTAVLASFPTTGGTHSAVEPGTHWSSDDKSSEDDDGDHDGEDGSWPLAKWQHQVDMPQGANAMSVKHSSLGKAALASQKEFSSKLVRRLRYLSSQSS